MTRQASEQTEGRAESLAGEHAHLLSVIGSELADESYVGSALTLQTVIGFLITIGSVQLIPVV